MLKAGVPAAADARRYATELIGDARPALGRAARRSGNRLEPWISEPDLPHLGRWSAAAQRSGCCKAGVSRDGVTRGTGCVKCVGHRQARIETAREQLDHNWHHIRSSCRRRLGDPTGKDDPGGSGQTDDNADHATEPEPARQSRAEGQDPTTSHPRVWGVQAGSRTNRS